MKLKDIVSQLANRINQPHVIEVYLRQVYAKGFVKGTKQSPWISVKERLPDDNDDLYIVLDTKIEPPACGVCDFDLNINKWVGVGGIIAHPTHWMPIPKFNEE